MISASGETVPADPLADQAENALHNTSAVPAVPLTSLMLLAELALLLGVVYLYDIEGRRNLLPVLGLLFAGALVHAWLPFPWRLPFFAALSMGTVLFVLGLTAGVGVLAVGGLLIGICYLPIPFAVRVVLLMIAAAALVVARNGSDSPVWLVVGSMFMFRLAIYLYDIRRETSRPPLARTLSYFFMAPNVCFPFFPVVDYRRFCDTFYNEDDATIYQRGVGWILRGIVHLLLYRFVKIYLVPQPYEVQDVVTVAAFLATNYALYLQVSGQFHLITGVLHLFGFNLPRTHDQYFLATSVSDIWRRINIYWKDFLEKLIFFPTFFAVRRRGASVPVTIASGVMVVFFSTWLLHSWQTYWLVGVFPLWKDGAPWWSNDVFLWLGVGGCVAVNSLWEYRRAKRPTATRERAAWIDDLSWSLRVVGMFTAVSLFWAAWTQPGFLSQTAVLLMERSGTSRGAGTVVLCVAGFVFGAAAVRGVHRRFVSARDVAPRRLQDTFALHAIALGGMVAVGLPWFGEVLPDRASVALEEFRSDLYMQQDPLAQLQSYYEDLNTVTVQSGPLLRSLAPQDAAQQNSGDEYFVATQRSNPWMVRELIPGWKGELAGHTFTINRHGMRDRNSITIRKPPGTARIALVGSSVIMGYAVADEDVFGLQFEERLNDERGDGARHIEVLNFGMGAQGPLSKLGLVEHKVLSFDPDAVYYFAHQDEMRASLRHFNGVVASGVPLRYSFLEEIVSEARITPETAPGVSLVRLADPNRLHRLVEGTYCTLAQLCRDRGVVPVYVYLPIPVADAPDPSGELIPMATRAGFVVVNLEGWSAGHNPSELMAGAADHHLSRQGHRVLAVRLFEAVISRPEAVPVAP